RRRHLARRDGRTSRPADRGWPADDPRRVAGGDARRRQRRSPGARLQRVDRGHLRAHERGLDRAGSGTDRDRPRARPPRRGRPGRGAGSKRSCKMSTRGLAVAAESGPAVEAITEVRRKEALLKTGALQDAIFNSANFSSIATDEKGVIQLFNIGAETMLGYAAVEVVNKITPADIHDPQEVIERAKALSLELATTIAPGFEALAFKASRGIEDKYELTYIRKDGTRFPAIVSVTALRDVGGRIIGYLLIGTDNSARKQVEEKLRWTEEGFRLMVESVT